MLQHLRLVRVRLHQRVDRCPASRVAQALIDLT
jgi:hypothetical protein